MRVLSARAVLSVTFVLVVLQNTLSIKVTAMPVDRLQTVCPVLWIISVKIVNLDTYLKIIVESV